MTSLTRTTTTKTESLLDALLAKLPSATELTETTVVLASALCMVFSINYMF